MMFDGSYENRTGKPERGSKSDRGKYLKFIQLAGSGAYGN